jgi:hypothetical protein
MFKVEMYGSSKMFEDGCNNMMKDGYSLHSWQRGAPYSARGNEYAGDVTAVFIRIPVDKPKGEGIRAR